MKLMVADRKCQDHNPRGMKVWQAWWIYYFYSIFAVHESHCRPQIISGAIVIVAPMNLEIVMAVCFVQLSSSQILHDEGIVDLCNALCLCGGMIANPHATEAGQPIILPTPV
jgi:hypothetical protein